MKKIECELPSCKKVFLPRAIQQRFCCATHRNRWHAQARQRIIVMVRNMGIGK